jgi:hypothetical protein
MNLSICQQTIGRPSIGIGGHDGGGYGWWRPRPNKSFG